MRNRLIDVVAVSVLSSAALAHGGQYRGPGSPTPPAAGGSSSSGSATAPTTGPSAPGGSGGSGSSAPSASTQGAASAPRSTAATPVGIQVGPDLTRWQYWWEFNKDSFLALRDALGRAGNDTDALLGAARHVQRRERWRPSTVDIRDRIAPALLRALEDCEQRDIVSGAMIALAKSGVGGKEALVAFRARLSSKDQEIRETAALAMGISALPAAEADLRGLFLDDARGRALTARSAVDERTRSFAGYALGLLAHAHDELPVQERVFGVLRTALAGEARAGRNVRVAAIQGIRLLRMSEATVAHERLLTDAVELLWAFYRRDLGPSAQWVQAHAPTAIVDLLGPGTSPLHRRMKERLVGDLRRNDRKSIVTLQSAALALGELVVPAEIDAADAIYSNALVRYHADGRDQQTQRFALIALGRIGGAANREYLLDLVKTGSQQRRPWAALALGVLEQRRRARSSSRSVEVDAEIGRAMLGAFQKSRTPDIRAALAIGIGLIGYADAVDALRASLDKYRHQDEFAGYACIGLALLGDSRCVGDLRDVVRQSVRRPFLLEKAAVALGRLGDWTVTEILQAQLTSGEHNVAKLGAVAAALGQIGDRRTIDPLLALLGDPAQQPLARAFAAVALGGMADKEDEPWNAKIGRGLNYRASVETLTNQAAGILDIF